MANHKKEHPPGTLFSPTTGKVVKQGSNRTGTRNKEGGKKTGPPERVFDWRRIGNMFSIGCTMSEVAHIENVCVSWLKEICERVNDCTLQQFMMQHRDTGKLSLRRAQYRSAVEKGNVAMQIWLGKNWLGQSDKIDHTAQEKPRIVLNYENPNGIDSHHEDRDSDGDAGILEIGRSNDDGE